jgi:predicted acyl esterase
MRDGAHLMVNVFRPAGERPSPVVMSVTLYCNDAMPDRVGMTFMRIAGVRFGRLQCSRWTGFEAPDPVFWTAAGYAVVQADVRGMHKSEGHAGVLTDGDALDYYDLIEWAARQPWASGAVGLLGVSYLAMSQWRVAALRPPALNAIVPWEGVTDLLREFGYQDGVPETGFISTWWRFRMKRGRNRRFRMAEDFPGNGTRIRSTMHSGQISGRISRGSTCRRSCAPGRPWHAHRRRLPVKPGEIVTVEIEILPSATLFEAGSCLSVDVLGRDADRYPAFRHARTVNRGTHTIHTGGRFDSHLLAPIVSADAHVERA